MCKNLITLDIFYTIIGEVEDGAVVRVGVLLLEIQIANDLCREVVVPRYERIAPGINEAVKLLRSREGQVHRHLGETQNSVEVEFGVFPNPVL